jgi:glycosyltransferase involved in cell wall biosynthesis
MIGQKGIPVLYGGIERHVEELSLDLIRRGFRVDVYTRPYYTPRSKRFYKGIRLISVPTIQTKHLDAITHTFLATLDAIRRRADIIHYHAVGPSLMSWIPRILSPRTRVIVTFHCVDRYHEKWGFVARLMLRIGEWTATHCPHVTIAVSRTIQAYCLKRYGRAAVYIPNGITLPTKRVNAQTLRQKLGLESGQYLLSVTRLVAHKGVHTLIEAYRRTSIKAPLVIVGGAVHTDAYVAKLHRLAAGDPRIRFTGFIKGDQLEELYAHSLAFIHPSRAEGLPIVLLEAMRARRPIIASGIPEHRELLEPGDQAFARRPLGLLFTPGDSRDLERQLRWLVRHPALADGMAATAQDYVLKGLRWDQIGEKTAELYEELLVAETPKSLRVSDYLVSA